MRIEKAHYVEAILPEHQGNPFIEALPRKLSNEEVISKFSYYPELDEDIRYHPDPLVREEYTSRLKTLRQPLPLYLQCFRAIETALKNGYSAKNPFSPTTAQFLHYSVDEMPEIQPKSGHFEPKGEGLTLIGESGVGKTTLLEQVLNYFPTVIVHSAYKGEKMEFQRQVVWVKVDCPHNSSVRELCEEILGSLDSVTNMETKPAATIGKLIRQIEQRIKSNFLGMLIIDEMQRLKISRTGGEHNLLNFLHSLVNKLGVPIFFCANPPFDKTLSRTLKAARRAESGGYFVMKPLARESIEWDYFVNELWDLHWTNVTTTLTEELNNQMYSLCVGNVDLAHRIYRDAQKLVIGSGDERITTGVLQQASLSALGLSDKTDEIRESRKDVAMPRRGANGNQESNAKLDVVSTTPKKAIYDITRPQHPEFEFSLKELSSCIDMIDRVKDPDLFRRAANNLEVRQYLDDKDYLCEDPLKQLA